MMTIDIINEHNERLTKLESQVRRLWGVLTLYGIAVAALAVGYLLMVLR